MDKKKTRSRYKFPTILFHLKKKKEKKKREIDESLDRETLSSDSVRMIERYIGETNKNVGNND